MSLEHQQIYHNARLSYFFRRCKTIAGEDSCAELGCKQIWIKDVSNI